MFAEPRRKDERGGDVTNPHDNVSRTITLCFFLLFNSLLQESAHIQSDKALTHLVGVVQKETRHDSVVKKEETSLEPEEPQAVPSPSTTTTMFTTTSSSDLSTPNRITTVFKGKADRSVGHYFENLDDDMLEDGLEDELEDA
ncbi:hypothetical protein M407DRAFT_25157 [Tulasnella calospora MUT 4182]|uniref:Uncharacterized protein n=1 Tax=Tulasnella calospora MUT 4182 TaxID=1051891 RepID=A0A0C3Q3F8_9AGAM|nr:hypothetical protein M407DRAFT_32759 [Tulasnella calospora MUT 4182]KIO25560.1 hypothetical protein M407DRAFT_25157 [Tulasnella calospora MUT 4182]